MAYVPGCVCDVFISYAHNDNEGPHGERTGGWVKALADELQLSLDQRLVLPRDTVKVFTDYDLPTNKPITPELLAKVRGAAVLLVVMSPYYLQSDWCRRELSALLDLTRERLTEDGRVIVLKYLDTDRKAWPEEFGDIPGEEFVVDDPKIRQRRPLGKFDHKEAEFTQRIFGLSCTIANTLRQMRQAASHRSLVDATRPNLDGQNAPRVFVARATDDLEHREIELRNYLTSRGLQVPRRRLYGQQTQEAFEAAVREDMGRCSVFAQLLSTLSGSEVAFDEPRRLPLLLAELARTAGLPIVQWRDRSVDPEQIADPAHKTLVDGAMACGFDEFERRVFDIATAPPPPPPAAESSGMVIFVDHLPEPEDSALAEQVRKILNTEGFEDVNLPVSKGDPAAIEENLENLLKDADGVIEVFGSAEAASVQSRFIKNKKRLKNSQHEVAALAIVEGPPGDQEKLAELRHALGERPGLLFLDSAERLERDKLAPFIEQLRNARARNV